MAEPKVVRVVADEPETASAQIMRSAKKTASVTDPLGRLIAIRKLSALNKMDLLALVGAENSKNEQFMNYAAFAYMVTAIDGEAVLPPNSMAELRALVSKLDDDGIEAIGLTAVKEFEIKLETIDEKRDQLKNG